MANFHHRCGSRFRRILTTVVAVLVISLTAPGATAQQRFIILASTTSTANSGLFDYILPRFTARTGIDVRVVAVGTGAALRLGANGDADVVLVPTETMGKGENWRISITGAARDFDES